MQGDMKASTIKAIMKGHVKEAIGKHDKDRTNKRLAVCKSCPLYLESNVGPKCNPNMWVNPKDQTEYAYMNKEGFIQGCGCRLNAKATLDEKDGGVCPADFWKNVK